ncbi:M28 family metallopeptidase [Roseateles sp. NT4]|uniref:M28 family metallopeptidase n=1 Tax=Roseateles sp. NT4 TaxID=3453715 RepID=UPI003EED167E
MKRRGLLDAAAAVLAAAALPAAARSRPPQAELRRLQAHLRFLADPLLEGREAGTRGFDMAAQYVAAQFAQLGLQPLGEAGGYAQAVPLKTARLDLGKPPTLELCRGDSCESLAWLDDFLTGPDIHLARSELSAPLVFVGYGITAPKFGLDDYAGLDVKGKIVVTLSGRPPRLPTEEGAHFSSGRTKAELAVQRGAIAVFRLATPRSEIVAPFHNGRRFVDGLDMEWLTPEGRAGSDVPGLLGRANLSLQKAPQLLASLTADYTQLVADAEAGRPIPRGDLGLSARLVRDSIHGQAGSHNIVGRIEGSHPRLRHEHLLLTAHLDHLGRKGDVIYPGAMDNAVGVALLLETARLLVQARPQRSVIVAALTAEEKGELGSSYLASHPPVPAGSLVAAINIDMPILLHDFRDVVTLGAEHSTLGAAAARVARRLGLQTSPDPMPEQSRFTRSDQYSFVRQGIPAIILGPGGASFDAREDGNALMSEFRRERYHQPGDDLGQPFHWRAVQRFAQLQAEVVMEVANESGRPHWLPGSFFRQTFSPGR